MPQRTANAPSSLRRSPRLQSLKADSPKTPNPIPQNPRILSSNSTKSSRSSKKFDIGLINFGKSANGSKRTTTLSCKVEKFQGLRRSPRFCNEVNPSINLQMSFNGDIDWSNKSNTELISLPKDDLKTVDYPVTPIRVKETMYNGNDDKASDSPEEVLAKFERRITRSCSKLAGSKVEVGKILADKQKGGNLSKHMACELNSRKLRNSVQSSVVKMSRDKGKKHRNESCKGVKSGYNEISSDSLSRCVTRRGQRGRQNSPKYDDDDDYNARTACIEVVGNLDRRITRSASKERGAQNDSKYQTRNSDRRISQSASKVRGGENDLKCQTRNLDRRIVRRGENDMKCQTRERQSTRAASKQMIIEEGKTTKGVDLNGKKTHNCVGFNSKIEKESNDTLPLVHEQGKGEKNKQDFTMDTKLIGVKRKRKQVGVQGWTKEQESALQKAYFTAKPSPDFWKKVAKLVPGKSAQECFDKVHSENQTPLSTKLSSRAKRLNTPMFGTELLNSSKTKSKKTCKTKLKSHVGRRTVRHLLQKYCHANQDSEADLFSILEPSADPSVEVFNLTPKHLMRSPEPSSKSFDQSSSGQKKCLSRFSDKNESPLTSPPVLKKVKNMVLHEKYIDQLHSRDRRRNVAFSRCLKSAQNQKSRVENSVNMKNIIKAAKETLVSDAKDVINKYQYSQANIMEAFSDSEEYLNSDYDEDETVL